MALKAYFDESGTHWSGPNACDSFVLCGYLAPESIWDDRTADSFEAKWKEIMHGKPFHATEMESNPQGQDVKVALANIIRKSGVIGIGGGISISAYRRVVLPHIQQHKMTDNPYLFLFGDVICEAVDNARMFLGENQDEPIGFVFANHPKWSIEAHQFYDSIKADPNTPIEVRRRMGAVAFECMERHIPLQASDHLAFESYHYMEQPHIHRPVMNLLMDWPQNQGMFYKEEQLKVYVDMCKQEGIL